MKKIYLLLTFIALTHLISAQSFYTLKSGTPFDSISDGAVAFADIDNDQDQDIMISAYDGFNPTTKLYTNDGNGNYTEVLGTLFNESSFGTITFTDIDSDNDQDVLITGGSPFMQSTKLFTNNGAGAFTEVVGTPFINVWTSSVAFADIDNDNDQDVLITGEGDFVFHNTKLYTNDGSGNYTEVVGTPFVDITMGSVAFADVDNDNDQDVLITGLANGSPGIAKLYTNDGSGNYTEVMGTLFEPVTFSSIAFADIDNDNDQDVLITGADTLSQPVAKLYTNDGSGNFTLVAGTPFVGVVEGDVAFSDIDNDNDQDVLITGSHTTKLYTNNGSGVFTEVTGLTLDPVSYSAVAFGDIDNDHDQDVMITGTSSVPSANLYIACPSIGTDTIVACDSYTWTDGITYTSDNNTATDTFPNSLGCDSVVTLHLTILNSSTSVDTIIACDSYTWTDGITYTSDNNTATDTFPNAAGCDSVVTLHLTILNSSTSVDTIVACNSYTWTDGITYTSDNSTATDTFPNAAGCDSVVTLNLSIHNGSTGVDTVVACDSYTWTDGITYTSDNNTATDTFPNAAGCDSVVTLNLTIRNGSTGVDTVVACDSYTWTDGITYTSHNNTATDTFPNAVGCDSIVTLNLIILDNINSVDTITSCGAYTWIDGETYTTSNTAAKDTLVNIMGCDSVVSLHLTIIQIDTSLTVTDTHITANMVAEKYQWLDCKNGYSVLTGDTTQSIQLSSPGNYAVEISDNGCADTSSCVLVLFTAVEEMDLWNKVAIVPNPTRGTVNIDMGSIDNASITVRDIRGAIVYHVAKANVPIHQMTLEAEVGIYILEIDADGRKQFYRIIKN